MIHFPLCWSRALVLVNPTATLPTAFVPDPQGLGYRATTLSIVL